MDELDVVWNHVKTMYPILERKICYSTYSISDYHDLVDKLIELQVAEYIYETIWLEIDYCLRQITINNFWNHFIDDANEDRKFYQFQLAVDQLYQEYKIYENILQTVEIFQKKIQLNNKDYQNENIHNVFQEHFQQGLLSQLPAKFNDIVYSFYRLSFEIFVNSHQDEETNDEENVEMIEFSCNGCDRETNNCRCQELINAFNQTNEYMNYMNLLDRIAGYTLTNLIQERITKHVDDTCKGIFDVSHMGNLQKWMRTIVVNWLTRIYNYGSLNVDADNKKIFQVLGDFIIKLQYYLFETYANAIIDQFFNIIIEYPDSQLIIEDLKLCFTKLDRRNHLIHTLRKSLETRLLHPGVNTADILTGYVATIKAIRYLDSSGILLETITSPVKQYMRSRSDTVRCVVTALTEEGPTDLAEELAKSEVVTENQTTNNAYDMGKWNEWEPEPVDNNTKTPLVQALRSTDIISMVVDIYGSKELFVNEYRNLLADRLLAQLDFNPEKEIRNLELLKLRFGETLLHNCEVMLKDISDSKRINSHIHSGVEFTEGEKPFELSSLILSSQFWPAFKNEVVKMPSQIQDVFDTYTKSYESYKGNRTLCWCPVIGRVNIEIELSNKKTIEMNVTPTQAAIICHFQEQNSWQLDDLSQQLKVPSTILRKRMSFWQSQGFIKETKNGVYVLIDDSEFIQLFSSSSGGGGSISFSGAANSGGFSGDAAFGHSSNSSQSVKDVLVIQPQEELCEDDEIESAMASASDLREEELQVFWSYIVGMLTNLDSLPLERIHQMLKMFASHGPGVEFTQEELKNFLQRKVREHKLVFTGGVYHLPK